MQFRIDQRFPLPRAQVEAAFVDPAFLARLAELPKIGAPQLLSQERADDVVRQRVRYAFTGDLSPVVRRVIDPARLTWVEESVFATDAHHTTVRIVPDHYADRIKVALEIDYLDDEGGTLRRAEGRVDVPMPLVGRKVEAAIVSGLDEHADLEVELLTAWLAGTG